METIKVNMTPCEDIKTIHASQNDNEAREWGFELHNNGEKIDSSSISDQLVFKAYEGGTEEILPTNGSTPTTSPFKGDIKYPQGLLSDQEFLYRESPTEEDGLAKITDIKGNTLVWNQLVPNGNFASSSGWGINGGTLAVANNIATLTANSSVAYVQIYRDGFTLNTSHRYLIKFNYNATNITNFMRAIVNSTDGSTYVQLGQNTSNSGTLNVIVTPTISATRLMFAFVTNGNASGSGTISNVQVFDLTQMGLDISSPSDFTSLFPLPYYAYNQGTLLSFMGNGIKTVSKNQFDTQVVTTSYAELTLTKTQGTIRAVYSGGSRYVGFNFYGSPVFTDTFLKGRYRLSFDVSGLDTQWAVGLRQGASFLGGGQAVAFSNDGHYSFTIDTEANPNCYLSFVRTGNKTTAYDVTFSNIQLELGTTETSYEPYTSSTLSLPISTYFPNGMKSVGSVYDELTETKAITRIGMVDLGTLTWTKDGQDLLCFATTNLNGIVNSTGTWADTPVNALCTIYKATYGTLVYRHLEEAKMCLGTDGNGKMYIYDPSRASMTDSEFKTAMSGIYLYYELKTSTETSFTTASLVTENAEIPLSNEDGVLIGKCTEQLSSESGFFDAKIKLADEDGECYSNKLQLHVERKPS